MTTESEWKVPEPLQPRAEDHEYDLEQALSAVVGLKSIVPSDAFTAGTLGSERHGSAILLEGGRLAVTIGYLVTEAEEVWLTAGPKSVVPAHVLGIDFTSGIGLLMVMGRLPTNGLAIGSAAKLEAGDPLVLAASGGRSAAIQSRLLARREFAGYWEYALEEALFTGPAHPHWGGTACIGADGKLVGIGSLLLKADLGNERATGANMVVPIDLLPPILEDLQRHGRVQRPARPWLGLYATEDDEGVAIASLAPGGPAEASGVRSGDRVLAVEGVVVTDLAEMWRAVWSCGSAGATVKLKLGRSRGSREVAVVSADRTSFLKHPRMH